MVDISQWKSRFWSGTEDPPWQLKDVNQHLDQQIELLDPPQVNKKRRFFVPLCGKTRDLIFLRERISNSNSNDVVIGCEFIEDVILSFFAENNVAFTSDAVRDDVKLFKSQDGKIEVFCCEFFALTPELIGGKVNRVWDRGSLVAFHDREQRVKYAKTLSELLDDEFRYLLSSFDSKIPDEETKKFGEGPCRVSIKEIESLYGAFAQMRVLRHKMEITEGINSKFVSKFVENLIFLTEKSGAGDPLAYWQNRWVEGSSRWHSKEPQTYLLKNMDKLKAGQRSIKIFVPLCGKAPDLYWLYSQGHEVTGCEGVAYVAEELFAENGLEYTKEAIPQINGGIVFKSKDGRLTIFVCDLFKLTPEILGSPVEAVFDRGSFEAIREEDREKYVEVMFKLFHPDKFRVVLNGYEYDNSEFKGPPTRVKRGVVQQMYGSKGAKVEVLEEVDHPEKAKSFGLKQMTKILYFIKPNV